MLTQRFMPAYIRQYRHQAAAQELCLRNLFFAAENGAVISWLGSKFRVEAESIDTPSGPFIIKLLIDVFSRAIVDFVVQKKVTSNISTTPTVRGE